MKFTKIRVKGPTNVDLPLEDASPVGPYVLKSAEGLGPVEVDVLSTGERRPHDRLITFKVGLQPAWNVGQTAGDLRTELYGLLTPKYGQLLTVQIMDGSTVIAETKGQVRKMEPVMFTKDPEVLISVECPGWPYLLSPALVTQAPAVTEVSGDSFFNVNNIGDAPTGFKFQIQFDAAIAAAADAVILAEDSPSGSSMAFNRAWDIGDRLIIDTRKFSRGVWRIANGSSNKVAIFNDFSELSPWIQLHGGVNGLVLNIPDASWSWYLTGIELTPAYWGV